MFFTKQGISIIIVLVTNFASAQKISFTPQIADFGIMHENTGEVFTEFVITNHSSDTYRVKGIIDPCGCVSSAIDTMAMASNGKIKVRVGYNPQGRPGRFFKQVTVVLQQSSAIDTTALDFFIKGMVLSKSEVPFEKPNYTNAILKIKPIMVDSMNAVNIRSIEDFINDLTFVLDKDGFANIAWQYHKTANKNQSDTLLKQIKKKINNGLQYRGYKNYSVGYKEMPVVLHDNLTSPSYIELAVFGYGDNSVQQSTINIATKYLEAYNGNDSLYKLTIHSINKLDKKINWGSAQQKKFIDECVRYAVMNGKLDVRLNISGLSTEKREQFLKSNVQQWVKGLVKELGDEGVNSEKINFLPVVFNSNKEENVCFDVVIDTKFQDNISWIEFQENLDNIRTSEMSKQKVIHIEYNNLPVFYQRVANQNYFDTTDIQFKRWVNLVLDKMRKNKNILIAVEATASNSPTATKYDNGYVARKRLRITQNLLTDVFKKKGVVNANKLFGNTYALVKGPLYHEHDYLIHEFYKYQYIKLIAVETDTAKVAEKDLFPYQVNFNNNEFEIPYTSPVFETFIESLIPYLNKYGYVELIVESSSSKVPTRQYRSNRVLAFERLQRTKNIIQQALIDHGYNPLRIVFTEERIMVQGPEYKNNMDPQNEYFKEFQYVKIIPTALFK